MESLERYFPFWPRLSTALQNRLQSAARERHFAKSEPIRGGEDGCLGLLLVKFGQLRVFTVSAEGKELTLYRLLPGDLCLFSASCILPGIRFDVLLSAEQDTTVLQIPAQVYRSLMQESAAVANYTSELMAAHFSDVMWLMDQILNQKLDSRLAALLLEESELISSDTLTVTHEGIRHREDDAGRRDIGGFGLRSRLCAGY